MSALLLALALGACQTRPQPARSGTSFGATETVRALRYRTFVGDPMFGLMRGGGHQVTELWFPEQGVLARMGEPVLIEPKGWVGGPACGSASKAD